MSTIWPEEMPSFDEAFQAARPWRIIRTYRRRSCVLHSGPGPEFYWDEDGAEVPVTEELREQWDREVGGRSGDQANHRGHLQDCGMRPKPTPREAVKADRHAVGSPRARPTPDAPSSGAWGGEGARSADMRFALGHPNGTTAQGLRLNTIRVPSGDQLPWAPPGMSRLAAPPLACAVTSMVFFVWRRTHHRGHHCSNPPKTFP